jgi:hypothetical protein
MHGNATCAAISNDSHPLVLKVVLLRPITSMVEFAFEQVNARIGRIVLL